jgi:hypothetical protein
LQSFGIGNHWFNLEAVGIVATPHFSSDGRVSGKKPNWPIGIASAGGVVMRWPKIPVCVADDYDTIYAVSSVLRRSIMRMQFNSLTEDGLLPAMRLHRRIVAVRESDLSEVEIWSPPQSVRTSRPGSPASEVPQPYKIVVQTKQQIEELKAMRLVAEKQLDA